MSTEVDASPASFEASYVHTVYSHIASDFSRTRHTRWPFVQDFLSALPAGSVVLDAGCGNGKYLGWRNVLTVERESTGWESGKGKAKASDSIVEERNIVTVGFDMSEGLLGIAAGKGNECVRGDCFDMSCWRRGSFDHAISIATIHHFATPARRLESVKQLILSVLPPFPSSSTSTTSHLATILIVVWALEQDPALAGAGSARKGKKGALPVDASLGGEESADGEQDVFVPWELQAPRVKKVRPPPPTKKTRGGPPVVSPDFSTPSAAPPTAESPTAHREVASLDLHHNNLTHPTILSALRPLLRTMSTAATSKLTLYNSPLSGWGNRVTWALEEVGAKYDYYHIDLQSKPSFYVSKVNPSGLVPVLQLGDSLEDSPKIPESGVITQYIAEAFPEAKLLTGDLVKDAHGRYFAERTVQTLWAGIIQVAVQKNVDYAPKWFADLVELDRHLARYPGKFLLGDELTLGDILAGPFFARPFAFAKAGLLTTAGAGEVLLNDPRFENLRAYNDLITSRPGFKVAFDESLIVEFWRKKLGFAK
ncbi:alkylated DNA repair protein alkB-like protein [Pseudohyphozyma bogoriensis]|nr:alkylated DNA repair protein alkB-like protein [Pseudohyphozyma bogoriensis]